MPEVRFAKGPGQRTHEDRMRVAPGQCVVGPWGNGVGKTKKARACGGEVVDGLCAKHRVQFGLVTDRADQRRLALVTAVDQQLAAAGVVVPPRVADESATHPDAERLARQIDRTLRQQQPSYKAAWARAARARDPEHHNAIKRAWRERPANAEAERVAKQKQYQENRAALLAARKQYQQQHAERLRAEYALRKLEAYSTERARHNALRRGKRAARGARSITAPPAQHTALCPHGCGATLTYTGSQVPLWACDACRAREVARLVAVVDAFRDAAKLPRWAARKTRTHRLIGPKHARATPASTSTPSED